MPDLTVKRTLVKSPPELWAELSEVEGLSRHLGEFGEIKISRLDPERTVAWEGEHASGTVEIEASSWGTKVVLTAEVEDSRQSTVDTPPSEGTGSRQDEPEVPAAVEPEPEPVAELEPEIEQEPEPEPEPYQRAPWLDSPPELQEESLPEVEEPAPTPRRRSFLSRWLFRERRGGEVAVPVATAEPEPEPAWKAPVEEYFEPEPEPEPVAEPVVHEPVEAQPEEPAPEVQEPETHPVIDEERALAVLEGALDNLGSAHHRPFSRG